MRAPFLHFALVLFLAAPTGEGNGQQPPAVIPTDLALALIDNGGGMSMSGNRPPRIVVGRAPDGMPASLTSAEGGTVIGGIEYPDRATVVLAFTIREAACLAWLDTAATADRGPRWLRCVGVKLRALLGRRVLRRQWLGPSVIRARGRRWHVPQGATHS